MKKIITFFKNSKNKLYLKLIEILLDAENYKFPKKIKMIGKRIFGSSKNYNSQRKYFLYFSLLSHFYF